MSTKKKNKKKRRQGPVGKSLTEKLLDRKLKKAAKRGLRIFLCEPHAHFPDACGASFTTKLGWVSCPDCENPYCRWVNYVEPKKPFAS